jgi:hypothetical protein
MPGFGGTGQAILLRENQQRYLFQQEQVTVGRASIAVQLERVRGSYYPWGISFQFYFTDVNGNPADPGAFGIDIQTSDVDQDALYSTALPYPGTATLNASFSGHAELVNFYAKYVRVSVKSLTNAVYVNVLATR